jgi:hypothetical protein
MDNNRMKIKKFEKILITKRDLDNIINKTGLNYNPIQFGRINVHSRAFHQYDGLLIDISVRYNQWHTKRVKLSDVFVIGE